MGFFSNFLKSDSKNKMNSIDYKERFNSTKLIVDINSLKNFENPLNAEGKEKNSIDEIENGYRIGKFDVGCVRLDSLVKGKKFAKESEKEENSVLFFVRDRETGKVERFTCNHLENDDSLKFNSLKGRFEKEIDKNAFWIKSSINQEKEKNANNFYIRLADIRHHYAENKNIVIEKVNFKEEFEKEHPKKEKEQTQEKQKEETKKQFEEKKETIKEKINIDNEKIDRLKDLKTKKEYFDSEDKLNNAKKAQTLKEILNSNKKKKYADSEEKLYQNQQEKKVQKSELENDFSNYFDGKTKEELLKQKENLINYFNPQGKEIDDFKNYQEEIESIVPKIKPLKNYIFEEVQDSNTFIPEPEPEIEEIEEKEYYENGNLKYEGLTRLGLRVKEWKFYYENGKLQFIGDYKYGEQNGLWKIYYENGNIKNIANYDYGKLVGLVRNYEEDGKFSSTTYYEEGSNLTKWQFFYKDGKSIKKEGMAYDMGEEAKKRWIATGEWKYYSKAGKLQKIETYENGEIIKVEKFK